MLRPLLVSFVSLVLAAPKPHVVIVALDGDLNPRIDSLGLPLDEDYESFVAEAVSDIRTAIGKLRGADRRNEGSVHEAARLAARRAAQRWSGKRPQVRVIVPNL